MGDLSLSREDARARTFRRMRNIFSLCVVAHLFVTRVFVSFRVAKRFASCGGGFRGRPKAKTASERSLRHFRMGLKIFFSQCFQGARENLG